MEIILIAFLSALTGGGITFFIAKKNAQKISDTLTKTTTEKELLVQENDKLKAEKQALTDKIATLIGENATLKEKDNHTKEIKEKNEKIIQEKQALVAKNARLEKDLETKEKTLKEQKESLEGVKKEMQISFENLAHKIFEQRGEKFKTQNSEQLDAILKPFKENIKKFEETVQEKYEKENTERTTLKTEIKQLLDLNQKMSEDAKNLTSALKGDSKTQGDWGEAQLEVLLEKSGLKKDLHFKMQYSERDEEGKEKRPDFVIDLPDKKNLIIDAKVSLTAYESYCSTQEKTEQEQFLKAHITSLKNHIKGLATKNYQNLYGINTPDYVLMFVPIEPALYLALQNDQELFYFAQDKNIMLVSSSTLMATMRTVQFIWKQENQKQHVLEMARQCGALYDKFAGLADDLIKIGRQMDTAKKTYGDVMNKLSEGSGNLVRKVENIKKLGAKTSKNINEKLLQKSIQEPNEK